MENAISKYRGDFDYGNFVESDFDDWIVRSSTTCYFVDWKLKLSVSINIYKKSMTFFLF